MRKANFVLALGLAFGSLFYSSPAHADCVAPNQQVEPTVDVAVQTVETCGGDDVGYQIPLSVGVTFDGQSYDRVYATTNSVITFGAPDGTYWDYPRTASISLYSMDWLILPSYHDDEHLVIQSSQGGFSVDISARPYGQYNVSTPTNIVITAAINFDGSVAISYAVTGPTYDGQTRTGVRLVDGQIVSLEQYGIVQTVEPVVLTPEPVPSPEPVIPTPEPSPSPVPTPDPTQSPVPAPEPPAPAPAVEEPMPAPVAPEPAPEPPAVVPEPVAPPVVAPLPPEPVAAPPVIPEPAPEVVVPKEEVMAQLAEEAKADDPSVPSEIASIPLLGDAAVAVLDAFNALGNVGADMTPEVRAQSKKVVVASVIVGQIATVASSAAVSAASVRRKQ
jgi:hypothetical protein